jgi:hypothetical protein
MGHSGWLAGFHEPAPAPEEATHGKRKLTAWQECGFHYGLWLWHVRP